MPSTLTCGSWVEEADHCSGTGSLFYFSFETVLILQVLPFSDFSHLSHGVFGEGEVSEQLCGT